MAWLRFAGLVPLLAISSSLAANDSLIVGATIAAGPTPIVAEGQQQTEIIELEDERYRRMTVPVSINSQGPFAFMIDTGAQATVISNTLADQLMLNDRGTATLIGMASRRQVETAEVSEIKLGSHIHRNATAALVDGSNIGGADGIIGLDALQGQRVLLDFENRRMEVAREGDESSSNRGFEIIVRAKRLSGQLIVTRARINGIRTAVVVDTGAQGSIGNAALNRRLRRARQGATASMTDINGVQTEGNVRIARSLEMGQAKLSNFAITFAQTPTFAALGLEDQPALILGMNELRAFKRVAIDFASRRVLFDLPDGSRLPDRNRFGRL